MAHRTQGNTFTYLSRFIIKDVIKDTNEHPDEEARKTKVWKRLLGQELWSLCHWGALPAPHVDVFTGPEAVQILKFDFHGAFIMYA